MKRRISVLVSALLAGSMLLSLTACSGGNEGGNTGDTYPTEAITMIVNYSAGGGTDLAARALGTAAANVMGGNIGYSNLTGGSGTVGVTELANSKNDGYTIGVATLSPLALVPHQLDVTYTPDSFEYICAFGQYGYGIVVAADSPYETLEDLIEDAKKGTVNFGATGYPQPFAMADLGEAAGASFNYVNYASTTDMVTDILGGFLPCAMADQASFTAYVRSGDMRLLASATDKRWPDAPDVETLSEKGYGIELLSYMGLCVPAGTDEAVVTTLRDAFAKAVEDEAYKETLTNCNLVWTYLSGEEYEQVVRDTYAEYGELMG